MIGFGEAAFVFFAPACLSFAIGHVTIGTAASIIALFAYFVWTKRVNDYWIRRGVPAPKPNFLFGNFLQMGKGIHLYDIENARKYGPIYGGSFLGLRELNVCDADMLKHILIQDFPAFPDRMLGDFFVGNQTIRKHMVNVMRDQRWKDVKKTITPAFTPRRIEKMFPLMWGCLRRAESILDNCIKNSNGVFKSEKFFCNLSMDVIAQCAFGVDLGTQRYERQSDFMYYALRIFETSFVDWRIMFLTLFPNVARLCEKIFNFQLIANYSDVFFEDGIRRIIEQRRNNPNRKYDDFLQLLMDTVSERGGTEDDGGENNDALAGGKKVVLSELELVAQGYLFLVVGFQTISATLQFVAYSLASNPHVQEIAYKEIMDVVGAKESIEYDDVMKMPYIEQVMNETLRMYPPVSRNDRKCRSDITLNGITIEKDTFVFVPTFAVHYDERNYPNPHVFDPDRFSPSEKVKRNPFTFVPFGIGPRSCIGQRFAQIEIRLALAYLLHKFRFSISEEFLGKPLEVDTRGMTKAKGPVFLTVERRKTRVN
ncbi:Cytochrome P450 3A31 [Toxocara canis]|uniref:Cytochrome P450 3A31 n=1 Tax=Toxocara canis TaxID=6265 RepID=A0A0B2UXW6_TOXCA|nr:Cytochrome P450 3A31 [Toxocara canis]